MNFDPTYLAPPLVGAFIGYMTNYVAIRMLFRPLRPWRLLGLRVPMTPGVIPAKRHDLARNIGRMVGAHLLTSEDVGKAVAGQRFQKELAAIIDSRLAAVLRKDLGPPASLVPKRFRSSFEAGIKILRWRGLRLLHNHIDNDGFAAALAGSIQEHLEPLFAKALDGALPRENREHFFRHFETVIAKLLAADELEGFIHEAVSSGIDNILRSGATPDDLLPAPLRALALDLVEAEAPALVDRAATMLQEPGARKQLAGGLCRAIGQFIDSLGPMGALAKNFLTPELIEEKVGEYLTAKGDDLGRWLANDTVRQRVGELLREKTAAFLATPVAKLMQDIEPAVLDQMKERLGAAAVRAVRGPQTARALTELLKHAVEEQAQRPTGETIRAMFGPEATDRAGRWAAGEIVRIIRSRQVKRILDGMFTRLADMLLLERPIGPLADFLPKNVQAGFSGYAQQQVTDLLIREVPPLVDSLDIERIVRRKVDSLDLLHLEELLLSIMREQFKYINLFGGVLGFLIGLLNLVFL